MQTLDAPAAEDPAPEQPTPNVLDARLAGALAAAVALGVSELVSAFSDDWQSLVVMVAGAIRDLSPGDATRTAIETVGTADKPLLLFLIVVVCIGIGAAIGPAAARRRAVGIATFAGFGALGLWAGLTDPLADDMGVVVTVLAAVLAGIGTLYLLLAKATPSAGRRATSLAADDPAAPIVTEYPTDPAATRRSFFIWAGAAGVVAAGSAGVAKGLRGPSKAAQARSQIVLTNSTDPSGLPVGLEDEVDGLTPLIMPNDSFYRIDTAFFTPQILPSNWELKIGGMVDSPYSLSFDELQEMSTEEFDITLSCVSNEVGGRLVGNARWNGVLLGDVLNRAGVQSGATQVVGRSEDGWTAGFPTEVVYDGRPAIIAIGMNGEPLPIEHGFPARLVVAGLYGYVSATKWLSEIELTTWESFDGYWIPRGWSKEGPIKTQSRIDVPDSGDTLEAGRIAIAGIAWAGIRAISKVEVQINYGGADDSEWREARLGEQLATTTWRQWVYEWDAEPGPYTIWVRATDGDGNTQTDERVPPAPDGATGWDHIGVTVE